MKSAIRRRWPAIAAPLVLCAATGLLAVRLFAAPSAALLTPIVLVALPAILIGRLPGELRAVVHAGSLVAGLAAVGVTFGGRLPGDVFDGMIGGASDIVSVSWPAPLDPALRVFVAMLLGLAAIATAELAAAERFRAMLLVPSVVLGAGLTALAAPAGRPSNAVTVGWVAAAGIVLFLAAHEPDRHRRGARRASGIVTVVMLVAVVVAGLGVGRLAPSWTTRDRLDPRVGRTITTEELIGTASLAGVAAERATDPPIARFRVSDRSGSRWRLFGLDRFDGVEWSIGSTFRRVGRRLDPATATTHPSVTATVTVEPLSGPLTWLPLAGIPMDLAHRATASGDGSMLLIEPAVAVGERISVTVGTSMPQADGSTVGIGRPVDEMAEEFRNIADGMIAAGPRPPGPAGAGLYDALRSIEAGLRSRYRLNPDTPVSSSVAALKAVLQSSLQGAEEQFVASFVLLARSIGAESRVAVGYRASAGSDVLTSADAHSWPEVWFDESGWVAFDPVPAAAAAASPAPSSPVGGGSPAVLPDSNTVAGEQPAASHAGPTPSTSTGGGRRQIDWIAFLGVMVGLVVGFVVVGVGATIAAKRRRRRRRLRAVDPADRVIGAWAETTDAFVDFGAEFAGHQTNVAIAADLDAFVDHEGARAAAGLAGLANAAAHSRDTPDDLTVALAIRLAAQVDDALHRSHRKMQRYRARITLRSLRRATRSPVR